MLGQVQVFCVIFTLSAIEANVAIELLLNMQMNWSEWKFLQATKQHVNAQTNQPTSEQSNQANKDLWCIINAHRVRGVCGRGGRARGDTRVEKEYFLMKKNLRNAENNDLFMAKAYIGYWMENKQARQATTISKYKEKIIPTHIYIYFFLYKCMCAPLHSTVELYFKWNAKHCQASSWLEFNDGEKVISMDIKKTTTKTITTTFHFISFARRWVLLMLRMLSRWGGHSPEAIYHHHMQWMQ